MDEIHDDVELNEAPGFDLAAKALLAKIRDLETLRKSGC